MLSIPERDSLPMKIWGKIMMQGRMTQLRVLRLIRLTVWSSLMLAVGFLVLSTLTGCLAAGVSSSGRWFIWPGGFGLLFVVLMLFLLLRRRR